MTQHYLTNMYGSPAAHSAGRTNFKKEVQMKSGCTGSTLPVRGSSKRETRIYEGCRPPVTNPLPMNTLNNRAGQKTEFPPILFSFKQKQKQNFK